MNERLVRALLGIASCATQCSCCEMHARIARGAVDEYRKTLSGEDATEFDRLFLAPCESPASD